MDKKEMVVIYDVFSYFPEFEDEEHAHVAVTKNKEKAETLVKVIETCGSKAYALSRSVSASMEWVQKLTD